jgi:hypothetical protein
MNKDLLTHITSTPQTKQQPINVEKIKLLQDELKDVEAKLRIIRASKPRQRTSLLSMFASALSPSRPPAT